jgi:hypothetical protein
MTGSSPAGIDHRDRNGLNNKWNNLRAANQTQNNGNSRLSTKNKSGRKGVFWSKHRQTWTAQIKKGKSTHLGYFETVQEAADAYLIAARNYFGEFAGA